MFVYKVIVKPYQDDVEFIGAFVGIRCDHDFDEFDDDGNEIYTVTSETDISQQLDQSDGVISYTEQ